MPVWHGNSSPTVTRRFMPSKAGGANGMRRNIRLKQSDSWKKVVMRMKRTLSILLLFVLEGDVRAEHA